MRRILSVEDRKLVGKKVNATQKAPLQCRYSLGAELSERFMARFADALAAPSGPIGVRTNFGQGWSDSSLPLDDDPARSFNALRWQPTFRWYTKTSGAAIRASKRLELTRS